MEKERKINLFHGEQIIKATNLKPKDPTEFAIIPEDASDETVEDIHVIEKIVKEFEAS